MNDAPRITGLHTEVPEHHHRQEDIYEVFATHFPRYRNRRLKEVFLGAGIDARHSVFAPGEFDPEPSADDLHRLHAAHAFELGRSAAAGALAAAGLEATQIDLIVATTCTGYMCPGLSAQIAFALGMGENLQRADLVGMGCGGAVPALQRAHDFVRAYPDRRALVVTVEVTSACWFVDDTLETVVGNAICADGAAACVVQRADAAAGPAIEAFRTGMAPEYLGAVGLEFTGGRYRMVLSKEIRRSAGELVRRTGAELLGSAGLRCDAVDHWIAHSGGRRVLDGIEAALEFSGGELRHSREVLRTHGNMSSPTVLFVLARALADAAAGDTGVLVALGPGLAAETALLRW